MTIKNNPARGRDVAFGDFVRKRRLDLNIGLREFASKLDLSPAFISKMEIGDFKPPKEENIKKMAGILKVDEDELLAKAGKISSELQNMIMRKPKLYASLLRRAKPKHLEQYLDDIKGDDFG